MQADLVTLNIPATRDLRVVQPIAYAMPTYFTKCSMSSSPWQTHLHTHLGTHATCSKFLEVFEILPPHLPCLGTSPSHLPLFSSTPKDKNLCPDLF